MSGLKVCLISQEYPPETGWGGIGTYTYHLAHGLAKADHRTTVISYQVTAQCCYDDDGVTVWRIPNAQCRSWLSKSTGFLLGRGYSSLWLRSRAAFRQIDALVAENGPFDIIEAPLWNGEGAAYSRQSRTPLIIRLQTPGFQSAGILTKKPNRAVERLERKSLARATLIMTISRSVGDLVAGYYGVDRSKIRLAPLGIPLSPVDGPLFEAASHRLLYVGRLEQRKGTQELIEALPSMLIQDPLLTVDIVGKDTGQAPGGGSYEDYCRRLVPAKLRERVKFHGFVSEKVLEDFYRSCDVFVAPSRYESFGLIYLEAMRYGKPVIGTRAGGIPEIVDNTVGRLVDVNKPDQISQAVIDLMKKPSQRRELGAAGFKLVRQRFTMEEMIRRSLEIYAEAIDLAHAGRR